MTNTEIICEVAKGDTACTEACFSGGGIKYFKYNVAGSAFNGYDHATELRNRLRADEDCLKDLGRELERGTLGTLEGWTVSNEEAVYAYGYFKAPRTGIYNFRMSADDNAMLYMNLKAST